MWDYVVAVLLATATDCNRSLWYMMCLYVCRPDKKPFYFLQSGGQNRTGHMPTWCFSPQVSDINASGHCSCPLTRPIEHLYHVLGICTCFIQNAARAPARTQADQSCMTQQTPGTGKRGQKKSVLNVYYNVYCNEGALSQSFFYTSIFHAQLCLEPWAVSWNRDLGHGGCYNTI